MNSCMIEAQCVARVLQIIAKKKVEPKGKTAKTKATLQGERDDERLHVLFFIEETSY